MLPSQTQKVRLTVPGILSDFSRALTRPFDVVDTVETANTEAFGDIVVDINTADEVTVATHVPVTFLMQLEKYLKSEA